MKRIASLLPAVLLVFAFAVSAHAQYDPGTDWKTNSVEDLNYMDSGCTSNMTADQCFAAGRATGGTCQSNQCAVCTHKLKAVGLIYVEYDSCGPSSEPGSCKCSVEAPNFTCKLEGTCYYHP